MTILDTTIAAGQHEIIKIPVGQLPSGTAIRITAHVFRAANPGPKLLLTGGVHGDEINGVEIVRRSVQDGLFDHLRCGTVIAIPVLNVFGFINFSRDVLDGKDVNRSFPGTSTGSLASRVAYALHKHILPLVDFGVDFHTGGRSNYNYPQIRYTAGEERSRELANAFGAPISLAYKPIRKSLRKIALDRHDVPMIVYEGGENLRYDGLSIQHGLEGIQRLLLKNGMVKGTFEGRPTLHFGRTRWLRASRGGLFQWLKSSGHWVEKGEPLGFISDPRASKDSRYIYAKERAYIFGHNNTPVVSQGDALFHLAYES
ncbi:MAG: succinylglutamate desuccinylase/aspartoacylase family protein [Bacteroidota bacterium]